MGFTLYPEWVINAIIDINQLLCHSSRISPDKQKSFSGCQLDSISYQIYIIGLPEQETKHWWPDFQKTG